MLKQLGPTTVRIPAIGQGTMGVGGHFAPERASDAEHVRLLRLGIDLGMGFIDTAEVYGGGHSEELVGEAVRGIRDRVFIATKFSPEHSRCRDVLASAEASLRRLQTDWIDLYQAHWPNPSVPIEETIGAVVRLAEAGKIRYFGVSNFSVREMGEAQAGLGRRLLVSAQEEYNLIDRTVEHRVLPFCREQNLTLIAYSPLGRGKIGTGERRLAALSGMARKYGISIGQLILRWLLRDGRVVVVPKASSEVHLRENATAAEREITADDARAISDLFEVKVEIVPANQIAVAEASDRKVYRTLAEAIENRLNYIPSPRELAKQLQGEKDVKPIKVRRSRCGEGGATYQLIEGRIRYWAWVIAHGADGRIPALVEDAEHT